MKTGDLQLNILSPVDVNGSPDSYLPQIARWLKYQELMIMKTAHLREQMVKALYFKLSVAWFQAVH